MCFCILLCFRGVNHPDYPSVLDSLSIANPVITNCLFDMRGRESILIIKVSFYPDQVHNIYMLHAQSNKLYEGECIEVDKIER